MLRNRSSWRGSRSKRPVNDNNDTSRRSMLQEKKSDSPSNNMKLKTHASKSNISQAANNVFHKDTRTASEGSDYLSGNAPIPEHCWVGEYLDGEDIATQKSEIELRKELYEKEVKTYCDKEKHNISLSTTHPKQLFHPGKETKRRGILKNSSQYKPKSSAPLSAMEEHRICIEYDHGNRKLKQTLSIDSLRNSNSNNYSQMINKDHLSTERDESFGQKRKTSTASHSRFSFDYSQEGSGEERRQKREEKKSMFKESRKVSPNTFKNNQKKEKQSSPRDTDRNFTARSHQKGKTDLEPNRTHIFTKNRDQVGSIKKKKITSNYYSDNDGPPFSKRINFHNHMHQETGESSTRFLPKDNHEKYGMFGDLRKNIRPDKKLENSFHEDPPQQPLSFQLRDRSSSPLKGHATLKIKPVLKMKTYKQQENFHQLQFSDSRTVKENSSGLKSITGEPVRNFAHFNDTRRVLCDESKVKYDLRYNDAVETDSFSKNRRVVHDEYKIEKSVQLNHPDFDKTQPDISHQQFSRTIDNPIASLSNSTKKKDITVAERVDMIYHRKYEEPHYNQRQGDNVRMDKRGFTEDIEEDVYKNVSGKKMGRFEEPEIFSTVLIDEDEQDMDYPTNSEQIYSPISDTEEEYQAWDELQEEFFSKTSSRSVIEPDECDIDTTENMEPWIEEYKAWFYKVMYHRLQKALATRSSGLCDPQVFLDSVARSERRSISCIPKGKEAKDLLRFVSMSRKYANRKLTSVAVEKKISEIVFQDESSIATDVSSLPHDMNKLQKDGIHIDDSKAPFVKNIPVAKSSIKIVLGEGQIENQIKLQEKASLHGKLAILKEEKNDESLSEANIKGGAKDESGEDVNKSVRTIALENKVVVKGQVVDDTEISKTAGSSDRKNTIIKKCERVDETQNGLSRKSSHKAFSDKRPGGKPKKEFSSTLKKPNDAIPSMEPSHQKSEIKAKMKKEESTRIFPNFNLKKAAAWKDKEKHDTDNTKLISQCEQSRLQEKNVTTFKREIERTVCRVLNLRYELEKYDRDKVKKVAKDALYAFEKRNKNAPKFSVEVALQHIKMLFKNPTRSSLDEIKRRMERENVKEHYFIADIATFKKFKECVFRLCHRNLTHEQHPSQSEDDLQYVAENSEFLFPQFCNRAKTIIKVWFWSQAVLKASPKLTHRNSIKKFSDGGHRNIFDQISYWLKMVLSWPLHIAPEHIGHSVVAEVQFQLEKFGRKYSFVSALDMVIGSQISRYFDEASKNFNLSSQEGNVESGDGKHMDQLIVLDEVYSDDSDAEQGSKEESEIDICDQISVSSNVPTIDLF